jgi:hypothetical protein
MNEKLRRVLLIVILMGISLLSIPALSGCAPAPCDVDKYIQTVTPDLTKWGNAVELAKSSPRVVLTQRIEELQKIRDDVAGLKVQSCLTEEHRLLLQAMDDEIKGLTSFLRQEPAATVDAYFESSDANLQKWKDALLKK